MSKVKRMDVDSEFSLVEAIASVNSNKEVYTIRLTDNIVLSARIPPIENDMSIHGQGYTVDGDGKYQIFEISKGHLQIDDLILTGGIPSNRDDWGGAILINESCSLSANNCVFKDNTAGEYTMGGATFNNGSAAFSRCTFQNNEAGMAGAILNNSDPMLIRNCAFTANRSRGKGGAIYNVGDLTVENTAFDENTADFDGGAVFTEVGTVQFYNSTFNSNSAGENGGAICHAPLDWDNVTCFTTITHVTIAYNVAGHSGGGIFVGHEVQRKQSSRYKTKNKPRSLVSLRNSIVSRNTNGDCFGSLHQNISSLIEDGSCNPMIASDPMLGKITGSPGVFPLRKGSPAINVADPGHCLADDQVGTIRPQGAYGDIGAFEYPQKEMGESKRLIDLLS